MADINFNIYDELKKGLDVVNWITIGYEQDGKLVQRHKETGEFRELSNWVEIIKMQEN